MNRAKKLWWIFFIYAMGLLVSGMIIRFNVCRGAFLPALAWFFMPILLSLFMKKNKGNSPPVWSSRFPDRCPDPRCAFSLKKHKLFKMDKLLTTGKCPRCGHNLWTDRREATHKISFADTRYTSPNDPKMLLYPAIFIGILLILCIPLLYFLVPGDKAEFTSAVKMGNMLILMSLTLFSLGLSALVSIKLKLYEASNTIQCPECAVQMPAFYGNLARISGNCPFCGTVIIKDIPEPDEARLMRRKDYLRAWRKALIIIATGLVAMIASLIITIARMETEAGGMKSMFIFAAGAGFFLLTFVAGLCQIPRCHNCGFRPENSGVPLQFGRCLRCAHCIIADNG